MIKVGVIGLGVGEAHIEGYTSHPECMVSDICDFSNEVLKRISEKHPLIKTTENANDILDDPSIDVVSIASYDNYHHEQIIRAIENGKHVFVEKPVCIYEHEALDIVEKLKSKPHIKFSSNLILRLSPRFKQLKEKIDKQELGEIYYIEGDYNYGRLNKITDGWRGKIDFYSGVYGGGIHLIDLFLWLTNDRVEEVAAFGNNISTKESGFRFNDMIATILKFKSGMIAKMAVNLGSVTPHFHPLAVYGTKGTFLSNSSEYALFYSSRDPEVKPDKIEARYPGVSKGDLIYNFIDSIIHNREPHVTKKQIFDAMSVCFAIEKATAANEKVKVKHFITDNIL